MLRLQRLCGLPDGQRLFQQIRRPVGRPGFEPGRPGVHYLKGIRASPDGGTLRQMDRHCSYSAVASPLPALQTAQYCQVVQRLGYTIDTFAEKRPAQVQCLLNLLLGQRQHLGPPGAQHRHLQCALLIVAVRKVR